MTRFLVIAGILAATLVPTALAADPTPADFKNAATYCKAVRTSKGVDAFATQYGTNKNKKNAFGKCVSAIAKAKANKREAAEDAAEATAACKKEQSENATKFASDYKNFGQCVKGKTD